MCAQLPSNWQNLVGVVGLEPTVLSRWFMRPVPLTNSGTRPYYSHMIHLFTQTVNHHLSDHSAQTRIDL
jgi:hypothetical protein